jgi:hypothetical protein
MTRVSKVELTSPELRSEVQAILRSRPAATAQQIAVELGERVRRVETAMRPKKGRRLSRVSVGLALDRDRARRGAMLDWTPRSVVLEHLQALGYEASAKELETLLHEMRDMGLLHVNSVGIRWTDAGRTWAQAGCVSNMLPRRRR